MPPRAPTASLLEELAEGRLLVLPSDLAARALRRAYDQAQRRLGRSVWGPPQVLSWEQWLGSLWSECIVSGTDDRLLLNHAQEHSVWEGIVSNTAQPGPQPLSPAAPLADLASSAWRLANAYGAVPQLRRYAATHDARTFALWADEFTRTAKRNGYLSRAQLEVTLAEHIAQGKLAAPDHIHFVGFLHGTPAQQSLLDALRSNGSDLDISQMEAHPAGEDERFVLAADSEADEFRALALWVRRFIEDRSAAGTVPSIGILVPELDNARDELESVFREVLTPELLGIAADPSSTPYEFTGGRPLGSHPMHAVALTLAHWASGPIELDRISNLLLSPHVGDATARDTSAQFDACALRQAPLLRPELDITTVVRLAQRSAFGTAPLRWLRPLHEFLAASGKLDAPRSFADWTEFLRRLLRAANWPGELPANAEEFQLARAWDHALDTVATLDFSGQRVPYAAALRALERQLASTPVPQVASGALVQVVRPGDAPGMAFDALVFARATDTNWPPRESATPLIDWKLQAMLGMPGADRTHANARAVQALDAMLAAAPTFLFTWSKNNAEGQQRLAPAAAHLGGPTVTAADLLASVPAPAQIALEALPEAPPPPLLDSKVHGGAAVLKLQAACGFRAFAEVRLRAGEIESSELGFDARDRGNHLHRVMDAFWKEVRTQDALRALSTDARRDLLTRCIDAAFDKPALIETGWDEAYIALQKQRLHFVLNQWLEHELSRAPFEVVATETTQDIAIGPLDLHVRIDRIDRVEQLPDSVFLVDYKTGSSGRPQDWLGPRPDEPQLPLYALLPGAEDLAGLAFAKVRPGDGMEWKGYASQPGVLPGKNSVQDMPALVEEWRAHLTTLAHDFASGDARVRPKEYPITCAHCGQRLLCRLDAATLLSVSDTDEAAEDAS